jgi:hypothetical protein
LTEKLPSHTPFNGLVVIKYPGNSGTVTTGPQNIVLDINNPPICKLKFDAVPIVPEERSLYLLFHSDKPLKLKSAKFNGKNL